MVAQGQCEKPTTPVTPAGFGVEPPTCDTDGSGTIPQQPEGVTVTPGPGTYGPGTYDVVFTPADGYVLDGNPSGTMTVLPATGHQSDDPDAPCYQDTEPETKVEQRSERRSDCVKIERRTWEVVFGRDESSGEWVRTGVRNDSGWVTVRRLTVAERVARGCVEVAGEQETPGGSEAPAPTPSTPAAGTTAVPTVVDAGI